MTISVKHYSKETDGRITEAHWCSNGLLMICQRDAGDVATDKMGMWFESQSSMWFTGSEIRTLLDNYVAGREPLLDIDVIREDWVPHRERISASHLEGKLRLKGLIAFPMEGCPQFFQKEKLQIDGLVCHDGTPYPTSEIITTATELNHMLEACCGKTLNELMTPLVEKS